MNELDKHHLVFDRPHVYTCTCGYVAYVFADGTEKVAEGPKRKVEYLPCGHAVCAKTEKFDCIICMMKGK